jgi:hypothetical protein
LVLGAPLALVRVGMGECGRGRALALALVRVWEHV